MFLITIIMILLDGSSSSEEEGASHDELEETVVTESEQGTIKLDNFVLTILSHYFYRLRVYILIMLV